MKMLLY